MSKASLITICSSSAPIGQWPLLIDRSYWQCHEKEENDQAPHEDPMAIPVLIHKTPDTEQLIASSGKEFELKQLPEHIDEPGHSRGTASLTLTLPPNEQQIEPISQHSSPASPKAKTDEDFATSRPRVSGQTSNH
jgi:hypothetical protein